MDALERPCPVVIGEKDLRHVARHERNVGTDHGAAARSEQNREASCPAADVEHTACA